MNPSEGSDQKAKQARRYQIPEKILLLGDNFTIKDETDQAVYTVQSKIADKLVLEDMAGNALVKIQQERFHLHPTYNILSARDDEPDRSLAVLKQNSAFFHRRYKIDSAYGEYELDGFDILSHDFTLTKNGRTAAIVNKKCFSLSDTYGVEIAEDENQAFILALIIIIDQAIYDHNSGHKTV